MDFEDLFYKIRKYIGPGALLILGIIFTYIGLDNETVNQNQVLEQTGLFKIGGIMLLVMAVVNFLYVLEVISNKINIILFVLLLVGATYMGFNNYSSIHSKLNWMDKKELVTAHSIQKMKDLRAAELAYRDKYGKFCDNADLLVQFVKRDSLVIIKQTGSNPGTMMSREQADELGYAKDKELTYLNNVECVLLHYIIVDTTLTPVMNEIFLSKEALKNRKYNFVVDSMQYVPFSHDDNGTACKFTIETGMISSGRQETPVFHIIDPCPFDPKDVLELGSLNQVLTSGNWGE